jgi:hypothetical protein
MTKYVCFGCRFEITLAIFQVAEPSKLEIHRLKLCCGWNPVDSRTPHGDFYLCKNCSEEHVGCTVSEPCGICRRTFG